MAKITTVSVIIVRLKQQQQQQHSPINVLENGELEKLSSFFLTINFSLFISNDEFFFGMKTLTFFFFHRMHETKCSVVTSYLSIYNNNNLIIDFLSSVTKISEMEKKEKKTELMIKWKVILDLIENNEEWIQHNNDDDDEKLRFSIVHPK